MYFLLCLLVLTVNLTRPADYINFIAFDIFAIFMTFILVRLPFLYVTLVASILVLGDCLIVFFTKDTGSPLTFPLVLLTYGLTLTVGLFATRQ